MKYTLRHCRLPAILVALVAFTSSLLPPSSAFAAGEKHSPLTKEMEAMNRSFRKLKRQYADPAQKDASLELLASIRKNLETSRTLVPSQLEKVPEADKAKYSETFQKQLDALAAELTALQEAIAAGKTDVAKAEIDKIWKLRDQSHKDLGVKEDRD